jgi:benzoyl-CoA-dihydrodiol lyase
VSFPETPLLGVLPGTGGLTRLVDKRKIRRDRADFFSTTAEGLKGKRALDWGFVDALAPLSRWDETVREAASALAAASTGERPTTGIRLDPVDPELGDDAYAYRHLSVVLDRGERTATFTLTGPAGDGPRDAASIRAAGADWWPIRAFRELDDAILRLRVNEAEIGTWILRTSGDIDRVLAVDALLESLADDWLVGEARHLVRRTLKRLENSSRSLIALVGPESAFAGTLLELALASDRIYMLDDPDGHVEIALSAMNGGAYPMANGLSRLETRFLGQPGHAAALMERTGERIDTPEADDMGLVTDAPDDLDWDDDGPHRHRGAPQPVPRRADRHGAEPPLRRPRDPGDEDLRAPVRLAELDLPAPQRGRRRRRADALRRPRAAQLRLAPHLIIARVPPASGGAHGRQHL